MLQKVTVRKTTVMTEQNEVVDEQRRIQRIQDKIKRNGEGYWIAAPRSEAGSPGESERTGRS